MGTSKQLITALEKSDWIDRMLIISGLVFFFLVVGFILKQRIFDRGLRIALWWTRFLPSFGDETSAWDMADIAEKGSTSLQSAVVTGTAVAGTVSSVATSVSSMAAVVSGTGSSLPEQNTPPSGTEDSVESLATPSDLSHSLSQVLDTALSGAESAATASSSSLSKSPYDEL